MARKKIREYDSKRLLKEHLKRLSGIPLPTRSAQVTESTDLEALAAAEPWISSEKLVVKPDMLVGKRGKSELVALNLDLYRPELHPSLCAQSPIHLSASVHGGHRFRFAGAQDTRPFTLGKTLDNFIRIMMRAGQ